MATDTQWPTPFTEEDLLPGYPPERKEKPPRRKRTAHLLRFFGIIGGLLAWLGLAIAMGVTQGVDAAAATFFVPAVGGACLGTIAMLVWFLWDVTSGEF